MWALPKNSGPGQLVVCQNIPTGQSATCGAKTCSETSFSDRLLPWIRKEFQGISDLRILSLHKIHLCAASVGH